VISVIVLCAGSIAFVLAQRAPAQSGRPRPHAVAAAQDRAAVWVAGQVGRGATVACDRAECHVLAAHGVPAASLVELKSGGALHASVVVATPAVRGLMGNRLSADAPAVLASFGSGRAQIGIRAIEPGGAKAYSARLRADVQARKTGGELLLGSPHVRTSPTARKELALGQVDARLLVVIAGLAAREPVSIVAFGDRGPGAGPGIPLRSADLQAGTGLVGPGRAAALSQMSGFLHAQHTPYLAAHIGVVRLPGPGNVLSVAFSAPTPLGLLGPQAP
jgi:hypothetical protein